MLSCNTHTSICEKILHCEMYPVQAVYGVLKEAEHRSTFYIPYWNLPFAKNLVPRQRKFFADLAVINDCLDDLIAQAKNTRQTDDAEALQARDYSKVPFGLPSAVLSAFWCHFALPMSLSFAQQLPLFCLTSFAS